jgi:hypothetical protein
VDESPKHRQSEIEDAAQSQPAARKSPPKIFFAACGALCDVFWWARRKDDPDCADS